MKTLISLFAGALYSAAYIAPSPYWLAALIASALLVFVMRSL